MRENLDRTKHRVLGESEEVHISEIQHFFDIAVSEVRVLYVSMQRSICEKGAGVGGRADDILPSVPVFRKLSMYQLRKGCPVCAADILYM